jgi:hypothetical protein
MNNKLISVGLILIFTTFLNGCALNKAKLVYRDSNQKLVYIKTDKPISDVVRSIKSAVNNLNWILIDEQKDLIRTNNDGKRYYQYISDSNSDKAAWNVVCPRVNGVKDIVLLKFSPLSSGKKQIHASVYSKIYYGQLATIVRLSISSSDNDTNKEKLTQMLEKTKQQIEITLKQN